MPASVLKDSPCLVVGAAVTNSFKNELVLVSDLHQLLLTLIRIQCAFCGLGGVVGLSSRSSSY